MALYYALPRQLEPPFWRRCLSFGSVLGLHGLVLLLALGLAARPDLIQPLQALTVRMLEIAPTPAKVERPKPKPLIPPPRKATPPPVLLTQPILLTAGSVLTTASSFVVAAQPEVRAVESRPAPSAPATIIAARFDADYLQNPKPIYPTLSRRLGEEGKVVLRVRVTAQGSALNVEIKQSSGHPRLDEAARAAVEQWRFVPARQGGEAIESTVLVPLHFALDN
jgi:protein TonB